MSTFQIFECVDFSPLPNRTSGSPAHTRQFNNNGHWPLAIPEYSKPGRWFNLTMDRSFGQCSGQMHYRRQTVDGGGCKIGAANGPLRCSLPLPRWKRGWLNGTRPFIFLSHFLSRMPGASLSLPLSLKICSILSLIDLEHREATNDICRVTGWEFRARDAGHFPASMLFSGSVTSL